MSDGTGIEWTDTTWNPVRGCSRVSEGCRNCYAERQAVRAVGGRMAGFVRSTPEGPRWTGLVDLVPEKLAEPVSWRRPRRVFVNSMSDLFHEALPDEAIAAVFGVMARAPQHAFQVLTKRPQRMRDVLDRLSPAEALAAAGIAAPEVFAAPLTAEEALRIGRNWPLPNVWLGVSVEDQASADERIPHLLATPALVRFVSAEPLLGRVELLPYLIEICSFGRLDWVIVGGESGPGARPCRTDWIRSVVDQCRAAAVPVFVKQLGSVSLTAERDLWEEAGSPDEWDARCRRPDHYAPRRLERKGGDPAYWPEGLRVREFPEPRP